jgi:alpha-tubulin suppressor-like RCC1 family protein
MGKIRSTQFVLGLALAIAAIGCDQPGSGQLGQSGEVAEVTASLTTVPSGVLCVKLALSGSVSSSLMLTVASGASSASVSLGYLPAGSLTVTPSAFNVACSSVSSSTVPTWTGPAVTVTVVAGTPLSVPLTLEPYSATASVNFVPFVKSVAVGYDHSYALLSDGTVRSWGANFYNQLGDGTGAQRLTPVAVSGLSGVASLASGGFAEHACAVKTNGSVYCWGYNADGELGNGGNSNSSVPVAVSGAYLFGQVSTGAYYTCGVTTSGAVSCWGDNSYGQFGNGTASPSVTPTTPLNALSGAVREVQGGSSFTCVRGGTEQVKCAGDNSAGQLGTGNGSSSISWIASSLQTQTALPAGLAVGDLHACAIVLADGSVRCVGNNYSGQLGDGTSNNNRPTAVPVIGLTGVTALTAGSSFTCAVKSDGTVWCWGDNPWGQLGSGTFLPQSTPAQVYGLTGVVSIAAGWMHVCAAKSDGSAWCWGGNSWGQLGDGTTASEARPVKVVF